MAENILDKVKYDSAGLVPAVVQDAANGEVLMVAYMNSDALRATLETGRATFWSRSRQEFWIKGATSGHYQFVKEVRVDCDVDCILVKVDQVGAACHTGFRSCFYRQVDVDGNAEQIGEPVVDMTGH
jgi:phosphoribosyl-AMP cyclohydrolase